MRGNKQGFKNMSYSEIINALNNLNFKAVIEEINGQQCIAPLYSEGIPIINK